eukprot:GHRQ01025484.1.p3 GENE.GHRQ01025484.1~~GHRQ01025484.1.p3  ORF type:complete len:144 (-),score=52.76 GHRQ01025484.1:41-472(-)
MLSVVPPHTKQLGGRPVLLAAAAVMLAMGADGATTVLGNRDAYSCVDSHCGYDSGAGSKPSFSALFQSVTSGLPCSRYASQSAWCIRRGLAPAAAAACHVPARCHVSTLHIVEVDAVVVWLAGAIACTVIAAIAAAAAAAVNC